MDRIAGKFAAGREAGRSLFVAYMCAGDPTPERSLEICRELIATGVDILELGIPFSDPLADGLTNQLAAERALSAGMTQDKVFELVRALRCETEVPIVFYTYYNLVFARGVDAYVREAKAAGVDALLTLDLPPEEADEMLEACRLHGMQTVFIVAPTTPVERLPIICGAATGFIYYVSREGVTGIGGALASNIGEAVGRIKAATDLPVVVGFGIASADDVRKVAAAADGVVVGSALVNCIGNNTKTPDAIVPALKAKMTELLQGLQS